MSTVLWANVLVQGKVMSDKTDHVALYEHAARLDALAKSLNLPSFMEICDTTDLRFNIEDLELPVGVESTNEVMAVEGSWMPLPEAISLLRALRDHIFTNRVRFGIIRNHHARVLAELDDVAAFAEGELQHADRFNFCVVM